MDVAAAMAEVQSSNLDVSSRRELRVLLAREPNLLVACVPGDVVPTLQSALKLSGQTGQFQDNSSTLIEQHLWKSPPPALPSTAGQVHQWLFEQSALRIPVTSGYHNKCMSGSSRRSAPQYLIDDASASDATVGFTSLLSPEMQAAHFSSESIVTSYTLNFIRQVWAALKASPLQLDSELFANKSETRSSNSSAAQRARKRPDTMIVANRCTLLVGEDKHQNLEDAVSDLKLKRVSILPLHYGEVSFLLGYVAGGTRFQWVFMPGQKEQDIQAIGDILNLTNAVDQWRLLLSWVQVYRLLKVMADKVVPLQSRLTLYQELDRGEGRTVMMCGTYILKKICDLDAYLHHMRTHLDAILAAYEAATVAATAASQASTPEHLTWSSKGPNVRRGRYAVEAGPCGFGASVQSEKDLHGLAVACCTAAQILHAKGLVHRDLRMGNIVQRGPSQYLVIDLESVAWAVQAPLPHDFASVLRTCTPEALDDRRCFTKMSDMHLIGNLLKEAEGFPRPTVSAFIDSLQRKQLTAEGALHYLQHVWHPGQG